MDTGLRLTAAVLLFSLTGCVSTPEKAMQSANRESAEDAALDRQIVPLTEEQARDIAAQKPRAALARPATAQTAMTDDQSMAMPQTQTPAEVGMQAPDGQPHIGGLALQSTGINASRTSIFATPRAPVSPSQPLTDDVPAFAPKPPVSPAVNSIENQLPAGEAKPQQGASRQQAAPDPRFAGLPFRKNDYIGDDDIPLAMAKNFYASKDLYTRDDDDDRPAGLMKLASLSGMARNAAHGLKIQRPDVNVGCFKPELVSLIKSAEQYFGRPAVVTSGFRDFAHNRRVGGAEKSLHMQCDAADILLDGVSKWDLARFLRAQPGRGGVGTYCHTTSVHIDIGRARDWNWRCRRKEA